MQARRPEPDRPGRLDRLWDATRPPEPPAGAFDALWAGVVLAADADAVAAPRSTAPRPSRRLARRAFLAVGVAQAAAAAVLVAALTSSLPRPAAVEARARPIQVVIPEGQVVLIHVDGSAQAATVVDLTPEPSSNAVAADFDLLNEFESMAAL